jgi:hypothetical protein
MSHSLIEKPHSLSIRIYPGGFSLYVYGENNHLISQKSLTTDLLKQGNAGILDRQAEINRPYKRIAICCESDFFTVAPDLFSDPAHYRTLLHMQHRELNDSQGIFYEHLPHSLLIYAFPRKLVQEIQSRLPDAGFYHHLMNTVKKGLETPGEQLTIYLREKKADFLLFSKKNLLYYNSFDYETTEDVVYHCLHLADHFHLNQEKTRYLIIGEEEKVRPDNLLGAYLPQVSFISCNEEYENYQW